MITGADEIIYTAVLVILIMISAFFSSSETAYMRANRFRLRTLAEKGNARAKLVEDILKEPERLISAILLGNNFVNVLASAIATVLFISFFGERGILYATIAMTVLLLIFGEITPKTIAAYRPDMVTLLFSQPLRIIILVLNPFVRVFTLMAKGMLRLFGLKPGKHPEFSEEDVGSVIAMGHKEGFLPESKAKMMAAIMDLDEVPVRKVMLPLGDMVLLSMDSTFDEIVQVITTKSYSRYPVFKDDRDNIVGYLHIRDVWAHLDRRDAFHVKDCLREAHFVPETKSIFTQLVDFQNMRLHMAFVVDEYGTVKGGITLEDIIEEITGDIADEHDIVRPPIVPVSGTSFVVTGSLSMLDLERYIDHEFPDDYDSLSGLLYDRLDRIPEEGDTVTFDGMQFRIERMRGNRIVRVRVTMKE
ncbi:MAG TPA: CNNM domain-containing protein [Deltaproteobacteria bacterium]|nr:CNNM domain-containing protein [Deltaproteobacteria bacterium]HPR54889.1 CNNM domain-containing protein [Deltaproteobacteria bacterium]HXK48508.1 CNNM domain-containing protein [Deltaproteobacteria bacterium]